VIDGAVEPEEVCAPLGFGVKIGEDLDCGVEAGGEADELDEVGGIEREFWVQFAGVGEGFEIGGLGEGGSSVLGSEFIPGGEEGLLFVEGFGGEFGG